MKTRLLTTVLFMAVSLNSFAQDRATLPKLKESTGRVLDFILKDDFQSLVEITYPTLFSEISEKDYLAEMKKQGSGEGFTVIHKETNPELTYGPITPFNGGNFCVIYYNYIVSISLEKPLKKADEAAMIKRFSNLYDKLQYEPSDNSLTGRGRKPMVAVSDNATGNFWNFILDPKASYAQNIIPYGAKTEMNPELYPAEKNTPKVTTQPVNNPVTTKQVQTEEQKAQVRKATLEKEKQAGKN